MRFGMNRRKFVQQSLATGALAACPRWLFADEPLAASSRAPVKITRVKTYLLEHRLKRPFGVSVSVPLDQTRSALLVKIETDAGIVGWGETAPISGAQGAIETQIGPQLVGQNALDYRRLRRKIWGANFGHGPAVGAVDIALNDIRGKALGLPVAELFGGRLRERVPAYASAMNYLEGLEPEEHYTQEASELVRQGFKALKMRLGRYPVSREAAVAAAVREAVGPDVRLMADGNAAYTLGSALDMARELAQLNFMYFEEPLPQSPDYAGYEQLRDKMPLPLAGGEAVDSRASAQRLINRRAVDIIQPDVSLCGGIGEALFIAELSALSAIQCIPHCWGGAILIAATVHLLALMPDPHWGFATAPPSWNSISPKIPGGRNSFRPRSRSRTALSPCREGRGSGSKCSTTSSKATPSVNLRQALAARSIAGPCKAANF